MGLEMILICLPFHFYNITCKSYFQWIQYAILITVYAVFVTLTVGLLCSRKEMVGIWNRVKEVRKRFNAIK